MAKDIPFVGVTLSPQIDANSDWYLRSVLRSTANTPTSSTPTSLFTSIANRTYSFNTRRGRTYELGTLESGECQLHVNNSDGLFDPSNTSSSLYPNVLPYRPVRITAAYPKTGNILNDGNAGASVQSGSPASWADYRVAVNQYDGTFENGNVNHWYALTGSAPTPNSSNYHSGSWSLSFNNQTVGLDVPCVAGTTVTFSVWIKGGNGTYTLSIYDGDISLSPITSTGSYTTSWSRVSVTANVNSPKITVAVTSTSVSFIDDVQVEFGSSATTNTTTGSIVYNLFNGFVERYPQSFQAPNRGEVNMVATDAVALMSQNTMLNPYQSVVIQDTGYTQAYYPLNESSVVTQDIIAYSATTTVITFYTNGVPNFSVGQRVSVTNVPSYNISFAPVNSVTTNSFTVLASVSAVSKTVLANKGTASSYEPTNQSSLPQPSGYIALSGSATASAGVANNLLGFNGDTCVTLNQVTGGYALLEFPVSDTPSNSQTFIGGQFCIDVWINWTSAGRVLVITPTSGNSTVINVNSSGVLSITNGASTANCSGTWQANVWDLIRVYSDGSKIYCMRVSDPTTLANVTVASASLQTVFFSATTSGASASYAGLRIAKYTATNANPSATAYGSYPVTDLFELGLVGNYGDATGVRFVELMSGSVGYPQSSYSGFYNIPSAADLGVKNMQEANTKDKNLFDAVQSVSNTELGYWFVDGAGFVTFRDTNRRSSSTAVKYVFGDGAGEIPYMGGDLVINYDLQYVYNQVRVNRRGGAMSYASDAGSINKYYPRTLDLNVENSSDYQVNTGGTINTYVEWLSTTGAAGSYSYKFQICDASGNAITDSTGIHKGDTVVTTGWGSTGGITVSGTIVSVGTDGTYTLTGSVSGSASGVAKATFTVSVPNQLLRKYYQPHLRPDQLVLTPARNPSIWNTVLALEVGDKVTVKKRPLTVSGNYITTPISIDCYIERVEHSYDAQTADWVTHVILSPA